MPTILEEKAPAVKKEKRSLLPELRELSQHLEELESDMSSFWNMNPALLMLVRKNKISRVNPAWENYFGYSQDNITNKKIYDIVSEKDRIKVIETIASIKKDNEPKTLVISCKHCEKDEWTFVKMSLSYDSSSDSLYCTGWPLLSKCKDCPFLA